MVKPLISLSEGVVPARRKVVKKKNNNKTHLAFTVYNREIYNQNFCRRNSNRFAFIIDQKFTFKKGSTHRRSM